MSAPRWPRPTSPVEHCPLAPSSPPLLGDESFVSWRELGNTGQPAAVLFAADGTELARWHGMYDEGEVLDAIAR